MPDFSFNIVKEFSMEREKELLDKYDCLPSVEPSAEWNKKLMARITGSGKQQSGYKESKLVLFAVILLIFINLLSFSKYFLEARSIQNNENMKLVATEYLISTNSSKY